MSMVKWEPMRELARVRDEMDRIFSRTLDDSFPVNTGMWSPSVDMHEENGNILIKADLPGVKKEDVNITVTDDAVTIQGKTEEKEEEKREGYYRRERRTGSFLRTLPLPASVNADKAQANFKDGTVSITLPKVAELPKGKKIAVK